MSVDNADFLQQDEGATPSNFPIVETREVARRVDADIEDVLATIPLVRDDAPLADRLFEQLVDLLLEQAVVELRCQLGAGALTARQYGDELARLANQCRAVGLLPRS